MLLLLTREGLPLPRAGGVNETARCLNVNLIRLELKCVKKVTCAMSKQFASFYVSWRDAEQRPFGLFANEQDFGRAAAAALQARLNQLADEGWIIQEVLPAQGLTPRQTAAFTVVAFR